MQTKVIERDRQTDKQTDRQTETVTDRQTETEAERITTVQASQKILNSKLSPRSAGYIDR